MNIPFFYEPFDDFSSIALSDETMHHALQVLRMKKGEVFWLTNGSGKKALCEMGQTQKRSFDILVKETIVEMENPNQLHLAIAFTKNAARIEWLLEKITEIGVHSIYPIQTKRTERNHFKRERLQKILVSAMLQSQQSMLPTLHDLVPFEEIVQTPIQQKLIAHCEDDASKSLLANSIIPHQETMILIGPEGDFTPEEIETSLAKNWKAVSFGKTRLRTETAGMYACAVFNAMQEN